MQTADPRTTSTTAAGRILERCLELGEISDEPGRLTRWFLSQAMGRVTERVAGWMERAGLETELDNVGNLIGTRRCGIDDARVLVLGSHLDTVRDAGRYDGALGVLLALSVVDELDVGLPFDLEVIAFSDEEGLRFGVPFLGSLALTGALDPVLLSRRDHDGISVGDAIRSWGGDPGDLGCRYDGRRPLGYLEAHIEQGPVLEHSNRPLGVLEAIAGACWLRLRFVGRAGHAGTTPMELRRDALPAAAEMVLAAEQLGRSEEGLVATVGQLSPEPGAGNVIPGGAELSLDVRHPDASILARAVAELVASCRAIADRRGLEVEHQVLCRQRGVEADEALSATLAAACGLGDQRLAIGAGHDAMILARIMPMTMLLVRSPGGISHHPDETVLPADVAAAHRAMQGFVHRLAAEERGQIERSGSRVAQSEDLRSRAGEVWMGIDG